MLPNQFEDIPRKSVCNDTQKVSIEHNYEQKTDRKDLRNSGIADAIVEIPEISEISAILKVGTIYRNTEVALGFLSKFTVFSL